VIKIRDILAKVAPNGHPTGSAKLRETIADLERQRDEALRLISGADDRANALLLADEDKKLDALEADVRIAQRDVDKIEATLPGLRERLSQAIAHEKKEAVAKYLAEAKTIAKEISPVIDKLFELNKRAFKNFADAHRELGEGVARIAVPDVAYHGMINFEGLEVWKRIVGEEIVARSNPASPPRPVTRPVAPPKPAAKSELRVTDARGNVLIVIGSEGYKNTEFERWAPGTAVYVAPGTAARMVDTGHAAYAASPRGLTPIYPGRDTSLARVAPARPPLPAKVPDRFVRCRVERSGYADAEGRQCARGDFVDVLKEHVPIALANGAIEVAQGAAGAPN
jgi:hypothetical protein